MKFKALILVASMCLFQNLFAANIHMHPKADIANKTMTASQTMYPGYCEIEIINNSYNDVYVYGTFDDGTTVNFSVPRYASPQYITLFYYAYCHNGMYLTIQSAQGILYSGWTDVHQTVFITPSFWTGTPYAEVVSH